MGKLKRMGSACQRFLVTAVKAVSRRPRFSLWISALVLGGLFFSGIPTARAAFVTIDEAGLDDVYSQSSFGLNTVDIRINPTVSFSNGDLLTIDTEDRLNTLFAFNDAGAADIVSIYFVDTLDWCDGFNTSIVGCADVGGNDFVVESAFAASGFGTELIAHELGHSLDLDHVIFENLMTDVINGNTTLTESQANTVLASDLIQFDGPFRFVELRPVLVTPLPAAGILFVSAILMFAGFRFRKKPTF